MHYRLIKPDWAKQQLPELPNVIEGDDFSEEFLKEKNALGYGVYHFPNHNSQPIPNGEYIAGRHIDVLEWIFVDMDLKDGIYESKEAFLERILDFSATPNKIVDSGNGIHVYWRVTDLTRETYIALQLSLIREFRTDKSIWTLLQLMRLPDSYNTKDPNNYKLVTASYPEETPYKVADLASKLPELTIEEVAKMTNHLRKVDGLAPIDNLEDVDPETLPEQFIRLLDRSKKVQEWFFNEDVGDRSESAWYLAGRLCDEDYDKKMAVGIIANTPKARSKGAGAVAYAADVVDKAYRQRVTYMVPSAAERLLTLNSPNLQRKGRKISGPSYFDCLVKSWRTQQCLGIVAGSGIGKSTVTLDIFKSILENSAESDEVVVYFNLEMTDWEVIEKWNLLTNNDQKMAQRMFVVSNEDENGNPRNINLQQIVWFCRDIRKATGKRIAAIAIDHIGVINPTIDVKRQPDFGLAGDMEGAYGDLRTVTNRKMPQLIKELAKQLDCFVVIQSQTTKAKGGDGDTPLGLDAAYGAAQFEQYMDYVVTLWQPLRRVHHKTELRILGWQYVKIRHKSKEDVIDSYTPQILTCDVTSGALDLLTSEEIEEFERLNKEASVLRKKAEKKESVEYKHGTGIKKLKSILAARG